MARSDNGATYEPPRPAQLPQHDADLSQRLVSILEATVDWVGVADVQGFSRYINPAGRRMIGIGADEDISGIHVSTLVPERLSARMAEQIIPSAIRDGMWRGENILLTRDGHEIPISQVVIAHRSPAGEVEAISTIIRDITELRGMEQTLRDSERRLTQFLDALPVGVFVIDAQGQPFYANESARQILGKGIVPTSGAAHLAEVYHAYLAGTNQEYPTERMPLVRALAGEHTMIDDMEIRHPDRTVLLEIRGAPILNSDGTVAYAMAMFSDITERRRAQQALEERALQEQVIQAQAAALAELSTPLLTISDTTMVMPLVGAIDSRRAMQMMESLLAGVAQHRANVAIIDITGVAVVDTQVANTLVRVARAVQLLGAQVVLTGIRPEVAQTLVGLGADISGIVTRGTLQAGIAYAMQRA